LRFFRDIRNKRKIGEVVGVDMREAVLFCHDLVSQKPPCFMLQDHGLEIGWTWLAPSVQRTGVNTECKYLLLCHAFEAMGAIRVQLRTHHLNTNSQRAIERLGAVREGVLRNHFIMPDGSYRYSVYYSIIQSEWPSVKARLEKMMQR